MSQFNFKIEKKVDGSLARAGVISTPHGDIKTPAFVTVGTKATVKALSPEQVRAAGAQVVLANTYHLYLEPGEEIVRQGGGLSRFMNWNGPTMTDSGGFQVFSLGAAFGKSISKMGTVVGTPKTVMKNERGVWQESGDIPKDERTPTLVEIEENGVRFKSYLDGSEHFFTPERSMEIQYNLGADIIFAFDECTEAEAPHEYQKEALERTHRWAARSLAHHKKLKASVMPAQAGIQVQGSGPDSLDIRKLANSTGWPRRSSPPPALDAQSIRIKRLRGNDTRSEQALFGIVQGARYEDLRKLSAAAIGAMDFDGFGIGGSFSKEDMGTAVRWVNEILPEGKPRHLLGIGEPIDMLLGVEQGIDTFDCVVPTRLGRNGTLYVHGGRMSITNSQYRNDLRPIEEGCGCYTCQNYTRAYIAHLFRAKEMFAGTLASIHNVYFLTTFVEKIRLSILEGTFPAFKEELLRIYIKTKADE